MDFLQSASSDDPTPVAPLLPIKTVDVGSRLDPSTTPIPEYQPPPRRGLLSIGLFLLTCLTTFLVPVQLFKFDPHRISLAMWLQLVVWFGFWYMLSVMSILLAHEMGHFLQTLRYRVAATFPLFIPMPLGPLGTMGAVISMDARNADRKALFDIGLSGPWAGLFVAIPISAWGIMTAAPAQMAPARMDEQPTMIFQDPLLFRILIDYLRPELLPGQELYMNPLYLAGWVGMLITGLNMMPIGQLDGGHTSYALFGRRADWLSRGVLLAGVVHIAWTGNFGWLLMMLIVWMLGIYHEPTANDNVELGWPRKVIGLASLAIPIFCFMPSPFG